MPISTVRHNERVTTSLVSRLRPSRSIGRSLQDTCVPLKPSSLCNISVRMCVPSRTVCLLKRSRGCTIAVEGIQGLRCPTCELCRELGVGQRGPWILEPRVRCLELVRFSDTYVPPTVVEVVARGVLGQLDEGERAVLVGKGVTAEAEQLVADLSAGSRVLKAPRDLVRRGRAVR